MDALLPALIAVLLSETGGKTQGLAHRAAMARNGVAPVLLALLLTTTVGLGVAAFGGSIVARYLTPDARNLLAALALLFAGVPMLLPIRRKPAAPPRFLVPAFAIAQFGDAAQFIVFAIAAQADMAVLAGVGGVMGGVAASLPAMLLQSDWPGKVPVKALRLVAATLLIGVGLWLAVGALRLI
jgi:Ca2+/H+ antiporter, TMEM165/GDT1 family